MQNEYRLSYFTMYTMLFTVIINYSFVFNIFIGSIRSSIFKASNYTYFHNVKFDVK